MVGGILVITLPSHNKIGLLFSYWTARTFRVLLLLYLLLNKRDSMGHRVLASDARLDGHCHRRSHEAYDHERHRSLRICDRKRSGSVHVAGEVPPSVCFSVPLFFYHPPV